MSVSLPRRLILTLVAAALVAAAPGLRAAAGSVVGQSRWVVDLVRSGDATSERDHEAAGEGISEGMVAGRAFRQASGWLRYTLRTFDDTEVSVACLCGGTEGRRLRFEIDIDGQSAGAHTLESPAAEPVMKEYRIPDRLTHGKSKITVTLRGIGGPTPRVIELRTVQEHLE